MSKEGENVSENLANGKRHMQTSRTSFPFFPIYRSPFPSRSLPRSRVSPTLRLPLVSPPPAHLVCCFRNLFRVWCRWFARRQPYWKASPCLRIDQRPSQLPRLSLSPPLSPSLSRSKGKERNLEGQTHVKCKRKKGKGGIESNA